MRKQTSIGWVLATALVASPALGATGSTEANPALAPTTQPAAATAGVTPPVANSHEPIQFNATPLSDCISYLQDISGINMVVDWKALQQAGISRDTPITLHLSSNVTLSKVFKLVLQQAAGASVLATYVDQGVLQVTTQTAEDKLLVTRVYPIADLLFAPTNYTNAPNLNLSNVQGQSAGGGGGGGASQTQIFNNTNNNQNNQLSNQTQRANSIINLITSTVHPTFWVVNGGTATIGFYNGNLVVHAPRSVQRLIGSQYIGTGSH